MPVRLPTAPSKPPEEDEPEPDVEPEESDDVELEEVSPDDPDDDDDDEPTMLPTAGRRPPELPLLEESELDPLPLLLSLPLFVPSRSPTALPKPDSRSPPLLLPESLDDDDELDVCEDESDCALEDEDGLDDEEDVDVVLVEEESLDFESFD